MNIGFYLPRDNQIKLYSPLIEYLLAKGCRVYIFCDYRQKPSEMSYKASLFPAVEKIPVFKSKPTAIAFKSLRELVDIIKREQVQVIFAVNFQILTKEFQEILGKERYRLVIAELQYFAELLMFGKDLSNTDVVYCYSSNWQRWWKDYVVNQNTVAQKNRDEFFRQIDKKTVVVGFPEADQIKGFDKEQVRSKYNIPADKKVVLLMSFPWAGHRFLLLNEVCLWTHIVYKPKSILVKLARLLWHRCWRFWPDIWKGIDDFNITKAIRAFCDRNDALLVVKGRRKNPVAKYLTKIADYVFFDEGYYPFTTLELLFIADLSIGFWTMAIMESILAQTPSISLVPEHGFIWPECEDFDFGADFSPKPGSFYNFEGVVYSESVKDCISNFASKTFEDYKLDSEKKDEFIKKFLGFSDGCASERIYNDLVIRLNATR
jgi:hypothetical protein